MLRTCVVMSKAYGLFPGALHCSFDPRCVCELHGWSSVADPANQSVTHQPGCFNSSTSFIHLNGAPTPSYLFRYALSRAALPFGTYCNAS